MRPETLSSETAAAISSNTLNIFEQEFRAYIKPRPKTLASVWATKHRIMPAGASFGRWRRDVSPYADEIMDNMANPAVRAIWVSKCTQSSGSEMLLNEILRRMNQEPCDILYFMESDEKVVGWLSKRYDPATGCYPTREIAVHRHRNSRSYRGMTLTCSGIGSPAKLSSVSSPLVIGDEAARYPLMIGGEGDFYQLAKQRGKTFGARAKLVGISSPLNADYKIEGSFASILHRGDMRYYHCPCPHCGEYFRWLIGYLVESDGQVGIVCPSCKEVTRDGQERYDACQLGMWIATKEAEEVGLISYVISGLHVYHDWEPWAAMLRDFNSALRGEASLKVFYNQRLGEPYSDEDAKTPEYTQAARRMLSGTSYTRGSVPDKVCFITCGIDVQGSYLYYEVKGWGVKWESYSIDYGIIQHPIAATSNVVAAVQELQRHRWRRSDGRTAAIRLIIMDEGYKQTEVRRVKAEFPGVVRRKDRYTVPLGAMATTRGATMKSAPKLIMSAPGAARGDKVRRTQSYWSIGTDVAKRELYGALNSARSTAGIESEEELKALEDLDKNKYPDEVEIGRAFAPIDYEDSYFREIVSEHVKRMVNPKTGRLEYHFYLPPHHVNEALDCHVMNRAAAEIIAGKWTSDLDWDTMRKSSFVVVADSKQRSPLDRDTNNPEVQHTNMQRSRRMERQRIAQTRQSQRMAQRRRGGR